MTDAAKDAERLALLIRKMADGQFPRAGWISHQEGCFLLDQVDRLTQERDELENRCSDLEMDLTRAQGMATMREQERDTATRRTEALEAEVGRLRAPSYQYSGEKPTIHELEEILARDGEGAVYIHPDGSITTAAPPAADHTERAQEHTHSADELARIYFGGDSIVLKRTDAIEIGRELALAAERAGREDERSLRMELVQNELRALRTERDHALDIAREEVRAGAEKIETELLERDQINFAEGRAFAEKMRALDEAALRKQALLEAFHETLAREGEAWSRDWHDAANLIRARISALPNRDATLTEEKKP